MHGDLGNLLKGLKVSCSRINHMLFILALLEHRFLFRVILNLFHIFLYVIDNTFKAIVTVFFVLFLDL